MVHCIILYGKDFISHFFPGILRKSFISLYILVLKCHIPLYFYYLLIEISLIEFQLPLNVGLSTIYSSLTSCQRKSFICEKLKSMLFKYVSRVCEFIFIIYSSIYAHKDRWNKDLPAGRSEHFQPKNLGSSLFVSVKSDQNWFGNRLFCYE